MIRTRLQTFSTTSSTCELYRMVFPADAKAAIRSLIMMDAFTSSPESGSSSRMRSGSWRSAAAIRIFWRMPLEYVSRRLTRSDERSNVSSGRSQDARDDLDSGGLAGAIGAEQADDLAPVESERYAMQDFRAVVAKDDLVERGYGFRQERILWSSYCSRDCRANVMPFDG